MANQNELINGTLSALSDADQAVYETRQVAWPSIVTANATAASLASISTQIANLVQVLVAKKAIQTGDLAANVLSAVNTTLGTVLTNPLI